MKKATNNTRSPQLKKWTTPEKLELLSYWARDGYTDTEIAEKMGVSRQTLCNFREKSPELDEAIRNGKEVVDNKVVSALLKAALGGETTELKILGKVSEGKLIGTRFEKTVKEIPPNVLACQVWLYNRQRDKWKRNRDNEIAVDDDKNINITITRAGKTIEVGEE